MWTPVRPCGVPTTPSTWPLLTRAPRVTSREERYDTETLKPGTGSTVTVSIPATDPAKVTVPETGDLTTAPTFAPKSTPQ